MLFTEFHDKIMDFISYDLAPEAEVKSHTVLKSNNVRRPGVTINYPNVNVSPTIYLDDYYRDYENGDSFEEVCEKLRKMVTDAKADTDVDLSFLHDWEKVKTRLYFRLSNTEKNKAYLADKPSLVFNDLSAIFYVLISHSQIGQGTIAITDAMFKEWHVSREEAFEAAQKNTFEQLGTDVMNIEEVIIGLMKDRGMEVPEELFEEFNSNKVPMFVITNKAKTLGASCLLDNDSLSRLAEDLESDLFVLPCSIHEIIAIPASQGYKPDILREMVTQINGSEVSDVDFLSDSVYLFSRENGLSIVA
ncbi:MAG: DUF5688 family protein [Lachnospiraceae bacterium]|nr:DUF5688 family protein [Lachnospiraceae bacterium]